MTDFDRDPAALAWARAKVQEYIDRLADFEQQAKAKGDPATEMGCGISRLLAERHFLGDGGSSFGVFDERLPGLHAAPTSAEEGRADRGYWQQKYAGDQP